jgi:hypothetical protein
MRRQRTIGLILCLIGSTLSAPASAAAFQTQIADSMFFRHTGVLLALPSGDLVASDSRVNARAASSSGSGYQPVRILTRHAGVWTLRSNIPPSDSTASHDLACDSHGALRYLTYQAPGTDDMRPILEEETVGSWNTTILDTGFVYSSALALDASDQPWIAMLRSPRSNPGGVPMLVVVHRGATGWSRDSLAINSLALSDAPRQPFAVDPGGHPHVLFYGPGNLGLMHAVRADSGWVVESIAANATPTTITPVLQVSPSGAVHVLFAAGTTLWHAAQGASGWTLDALPLSARGWSCALAFDHSEQPRVVYSTGPTAPDYNSLGSVVYAYRTPSGWAPTLVHDDSLQNRRLQIALDDQDRATLFIHDPFTRQVITASQVDVADVAITTPAGAMHLAFGGRHPSPVGMTMRWVVTLPMAATVTLEAYDLSGRLVGSSGFRELPAGSNVIAWSPPVRMPGTWFVTLRSGEIRTASLRWVTR